MAKVKNQDIPTDIFEETLDPPLEFPDQYRRVLSEGIDHPKLPAGEEIVTFSKKESRPAQRSSNPYRNKPLQDEQRAIFSECLACWSEQFEIDEEVNDCSSKISKHHVKPWHYVPGARPTFFNQFMSDCLNWRSSNPGVPYPPCEDLNITPSTFEFCPGEFQTFEISNGNGPHLTNWPCGSYIDAWTWEADPDYESCPSSITLSFVDLDGRKGCTHGTKKPADQCCCPSKPPIALLYTTQGMACEEQQEISVDPANPGCPPYNWSLTGGGEITILTNSSILYTAPSSNPNCAGNPTITVSDLCHQEAIVQLAINCFTGIAGDFFTWVQVGTGGPCGDPPTMYYKWEVFHQYIYCDGSLSVMEETPWSSPWTVESTPPQWPSGVACVAGASPNPVCLWCSDYLIFYTATCLGYPALYCEGAHDTRSEYQKSMGCCPPQFL